MELLSDAVARTDRHSPWNEVFALVLLFVGTLLFFALISYTPKDVPSWVWFSNISPANHPAQNFIGPVGAIVAGICYQLIGAAAYLLAAILLGFGAAKLFYPSLRVTRRLAWIILFIVSGACLLHVQPYHLRGWHAAFNIQGPGGWVGYHFADEHHGLLRNALGEVGSVILLIGIYATTLLWVPARRKPSLAELRASEEKAKPAPSLTSRAWKSENYALPGVDLLDEHNLEGRTAADPSELEHVQQILIDTLAQFGIAVAPGDITKGPTITRYEVYPAKGVRVDKIVSLERDLARATRAERINILAPIPGKDTVGIELANTR